MIFMIIVMLALLATVWTWYSRNYGKPGFDDWDREEYDGSPDWHIKP